MMANLRLILRLLALAAALLVALPLHGLWRVVGHASPWPRRFLGICARIAGARLRIVGMPLTGDVVILANHLSWLDILLLADAANAVFVAKDELRTTPLVGWLAGLNNTIYVARGDRMAIGGQVADIRGALGPRPVAIFPEGTTGDGTTLLPFKSALLAVLVPPPPGIRVQPVRIDYGAAVADLTWIGEETGAANALRILRRRGSFAATLRFAEPFVPTGDRKAIAAEARARIVSMAT